jgi:Phosphoesterase family
MRPRRPGQRGSRLQRHRRDRLPHSCLPFGKLFPPLFLKNQGTKIVPVAAFFTDAAAGKLPGFCLVEPEYGTADEENPQNIARGEAFAAQVINAVMAGAAWERTLLSSPATRAAPARSRRRVRSPAARTDRRGRFRLPEYRTSQVSRHGPGVEPQPPPQHPVGRPDQPELVA